MKPRRAQGNAGKTPRKHRIFLVEEHPVTREGFAQLLSREPDLEVCGKVGTASAALTALASANPNLVVLGLWLPDACGLELIKNLSTRFPGLALLVLSSCDEALYAERVMRGGARGYVMKQATVKTVLTAIRTVLSGELYLSEPMRSRIVHQFLNTSGSHPRSNVDMLSDRELEIFEHLGQGQTTKAIADRLHLSVSTVETHRAHIKTKLKLTNATELVRRAVAWVNEQEQGRGRIVESTMPES
jgi:DNA-binding NarL/FixJ family response regulator